MSVLKLPDTNLTNTATEATMSASPVGETLLRRVLGNCEKPLHGKPELDPQICMVII